MKKTRLLIITIAVLLCLVTSVSGKGTLEDFDAYKTYIGKTIRLVKIIQPNALELTENSLLVDAVLNDEKDGIDVGLSVFFTDKKVDSICIFYSTNYLQQNNIEIDTDESLKILFELSAYLLGIKYDPDANIKKTSDGLPYITNSDDVICLANINNADNVAVLCGPNQSNDSGTTPSNNGGKGSGNVAKNSQMIMTLEETKYQGNVLVATFLVENLSDSPIYINSFYFDAKDGNYERLSVSWFNCPGSSISGNVLAGDKVRGNICFENATKKPIIITYRPDLWSSELFSFTVK